MGVVTIAVQAVLDLVAVLEGNLHALVVQVGAVALGLVQVFRVDTHHGQGGLHIHLVVAGV